MADTNNHAENDISVPSSEEASSQSVKRLDSTGEKEESLLDAFNNAINEQYSPVNGYSLEPSSDQTNGDAPVNGAADSSPSLDEDEPKSESDPKSEDEPKSENEPKSEDEPKSVSIDTGEEPPATEPPAAVPAEQNGNLNNLESVEILEPLPEGKEVNIINPTPQPPKDEDANDPSADIVLSNAETDLLEKLKTAPFEVTEELESLTNQQRERLNLYQRRESLARTGSVKRESSTRSSMKKSNAAAGEDEPVVDTNSDLYKCMRLLAPKPYILSPDSQAATPADGRSRTLPHARMSSEGDIFKNARALTLDRGNKSQEDLDRNRVSLNHMRLQFLGLEIPKDSNHDVESPITPQESNKLESVPENNESPKKPPKRNPLYRLLCGSNRSK